MVDLKDRNTQIIIGAIVLVVVVALAWWALAHRSSTTEMAQEQQPSTTTSTSGEQPSKTVASNPTAVASGDSVKVGDQPAGDSVRVESVTLSQPGWVAVRDSSGHTLGAGWYDAGTHENVSVPLLRNTTVGEHYQVLLYVDTNNDHKFDVHTETLVLNSDGTVAGTNFSALNGD